MLFVDTKRESGLSEEEELYYQKKVFELAEAVRDHEHQIVDMLFEKGKMEGITDVQLKHFVDSRVNTCLEQLGYAKLYDVKYNPIADWFYDGINKYMMNDFFQGVGREYVRDWDATGFVWKTNKENV